jgi:putative peptidoglycan lipid II flippase
MSAASNSRPRQSDDTTNDAAASTTSSVGRNSLIMASGVFVSRLTGQLRSILLVASLGVTGIAADAFQVGSQMPNVVLNLITGGVFNAILVPQIVKALKARDGEHKLNKLITLSVILLLAFTAVMFALTPVLVNIMSASNWTPAQRALAEAFTLWSLPQIFFYGLYTVVGQVLAAKDRFGMYAWSSVATNIISIAGFSAFIFIFGNASGKSLGFWTGEPVFLSAGVWTIGVGVQALLCFIPLVKLGLKLRPEFGIHGIGLRSMGRVAAWTLAAVVVDQIINIIVTRVATGATGSGGLDVAGAQAYNQSFQIYVLPYALITVSLATAVFPRISRAVANRQIDQARADLSNSIRTSIAAIVLFVAFFIAIPVPIIRAILPSINSHIGDANLMAAPLIGLAIALVPSSIALLVRRTFFAFEDGFSPFVYVLAQDGLEAVIILVAQQFAPASSWVFIICLSMGISTVVCIPIMLFLMRKKMGGRMDGRRILSTFVRIVIGGAVAAVIGILIKPVIQKIVGFSDVSSSGTGWVHGWLQSLAVCVIIGLIIIVIYFFSLKALKVNELSEFIGSIAHRGKRGENAPAEREEASQSIRTIQSLAADVAEANSLSPVDLFVQPISKELLDAQIPVGEQKAEVHTALPVLERQSEHLDSGSQGNPRDISENSPVPAPYGGSNEHKIEDEYDRRNQDGQGFMTPAIGDIINDRYTLTSLLRSEAGISAWLATDRSLATDCQIFIISDTARYARINAIASSLALSKNPHFTKVLYLAKQAGILLIVTEVDQGFSLHSLISPHQIDEGDNGVIGVEAIRTIAGETAIGAQDLLKISLSHHAITAHTVRVSKDAVTLADAPISPMIASLIDSPDFRKSTEQLTITQVAAVLFEMVTGREYDPLLDRSSEDIDEFFASFTPKGQAIPSEFGMICSRALEIPDRDGKEPIPIYTLNEFFALLGPWKPVSELTEDDISIPAMTGKTSVETVTFLPPAANSVIPIPAAFMGGAQSDEGNQDGTQASAAQNSQWKANQLLFAGAAAVEELNNDDSSDFLAAFNTSDDMSVPSSILPTINADSTGSAAGEYAEQAGETQAMRVSPASISPASQVLKTGDLSQPYPPQPYPPQSESEQEVPPSIPPSTPAEPIEPAQLPIEQSEPAPQQTDDIEAVEELQEEIDLPPSFAPSFKPSRTPQREPDTSLPLQQNQQFPPVASHTPSRGEQINQTGLRTRGHQSENDQSKSSSGKNGSKARTTVIIVAIVIVVAALIWSITRLGIGSSPDLGSGSGSSWSSNEGNVPFPGKQDSSGTQSQKKTQTNDKPAKSAPKPKATNTVAYKITTSVVRNIAGRSGVGMYIHVTDGVKSVSRIELNMSSATTAGGAGEIYAGAIPTNSSNWGNPIAQFSFAATGTPTEIKFNPVNAQDLVVWISQSPQGGAYFDSIRVY